MVPLCRDCERLITSMQINFADVVKQTMYTGLILAWRPANERRWAQTYPCER